MGKFKLIAGLGNKDKNRVKDLVLLWLKAGAEGFDISASSLQFVQTAIKNNGYRLDDYEFSTSIFLKGDIHGKKAKILLDKCNFCRECEKKCTEHAIKTPYIDELRCIGCYECLEACKFSAIDFYNDTTEDFFDLLKTDVKLDIVTIYISIEDKTKIVPEFSEILDKITNKKPKIQVALSRKYFSNKDIEEILIKLKEITSKKGFQLVVQADGNSLVDKNEGISGAIEAVACALLIKKSGFDEITISGGCNEHSAKLVKSANLNCSVAYGSYARNLIDGLEYDEALRMAEFFASKSKEFLND